MPPSLLDARQHVRQRLPRPCAGRKPAASGSGTAGPSPQTFPRRRAISGVMPAFSVRWRAAIWRLRRARRGARDVRRSGSGSDPWRQAGRWDGSWPRRARGICREVHQRVATARDRQRQQVRRQPRRIPTPPSRKCRYGPGTCTEYRTGGPQPVEVEAGQVHDLRRPRERAGASTPGLRDLFRTDRAAPGASPRFRTRQGRGPARRSTRSARLMPPLQAAPAPPPATGRSAFPTHSRQADERCATPP